MNADTPEDALVEWLATYGPVQIGTIHKEFAAVGGGLVIRLLEEGRIVWLWCDPDHDHDLYCSVGVPDETI